MTKSENQTLVKDPCKVRLRPTRLTVAVLKIIREASEPIQFKNIITEGRKVVGNMDKVSFYRVIDRLKKAGLIHEVEGKSFVLAENSPQIIFKCLNCNNTHKSHDSKEAVKLQRIFAESEYLKDLKVISLKGICGGCAS